jgi:hypothetical protein
MVHAKEREAENATFVGPSLWSRKLIKALLEIACTITPRINLAVDERF